MYRGTEIPGNGQLFRFDGGLATAKPVATLGINQATDLRNVFVTPGGGLEKRRGNTTFNASAMVNGSTAVTGLAYYKQADGDDFLVATAGTKIFKSDSLDGTMDDITGSATVTSSATNYYDIFTFNNKFIGVGGAPDAPFTSDGTAAADLNANAPSGNFGFQHNNRVFIGNTAADPSRISWSILSDATDWVGQGSGSQDVWTNNNDGLTGAAILNTDNVLLFKETSTHIMTGRRHPFPVFPLFADVGAVGKHAIVVADGLCYFISSNPSRMMVTDGVRILDQEFPNLHDIDDRWDNLSKSRNKFIQGIRHKGIDFDHIIWLCSDASSATHDLALVWDLRHKCWLRHTQGHTGNIMARTQDGTFYMGAYDGTAYTMDVANVYSDASSSSSAIDAYWASGWNTATGFLGTVKPFTINTIIESKTAGNIEIGYGFDFANDQKSVSKNMSAPGSNWDEFNWDEESWGGQSDLKRSVRVKGRGNVFQNSFKQSVVDQNFKIHGYSISGKSSGQKVFSAV